MKYCTVPCFLLALLTLCLHATLGAPTPLFYVATNGNDAWSGRLPAPNKARTDGPFATIERASMALRPEVVPENRERRDLVVEVRGGFYPLQKPITLTAADSGSFVTPITYAAYPGETPIFSGGTRIVGWKRISGNRWKVTVPDVSTGRWYFSQLYVNGERRYRPRMPRQGYYYAGGSPPSDGQPGTNRLHYEGTNEPSTDWHALTDVEVLPFHIWEMSRFHVSSIDPATRTITFSGRSPEVPRGYRFLLENVREGLGEPGQWYLDRATGVLTYLAKPGEDPNRETVVAPRIARLVDISGASNITFRGLTFADAAYDLPPQGHSDPQAEVNVDAAIRLDHTRFCHFDNCTVRNVGGYAINLDRGCQDCRIEGCLLTDLGGGGVRAGVASGWNPSEAEADKTIRNTIADCRIIHGGRIFPGAIGVFVANASYTAISHNEIADFYYTGISIGWSWGYGPSGAHHNTVAYNDIHRIGQGVLSDMGGIYTLGVSPGTLLDHNRIRDVYSYDYGGWGIYFDEGSTGIVAHDDIAYDVKSEPFHQHYGTLNLVDNCILALGHEAQLRRSRGDNGPQATPDKRAESSFTIQHCLVYSDGAPLFNANWDGTNFKLASNLYYSTDSHHPARFPGNKTLAEWQDAGHDAGSIVADPLFVDPKAGDFRLRPGSPASKVGFKPIDLSGIGPRASAGLPAMRDANVPRAFPPPPPIADDFEQTGVGEKPGGLDVVVDEETDHPAAYIRVTDEAALSGKHSLKFQDAPGQRFSYSPHLYYHPAYTTGTWTGRFALRMEPGAIFYHEWRDSASPYNVGPSLTVGADDLLVASGKPLLKLPRSQWIRIAITCALGDTATGTYDLSVQLPGEPTPHRFVKLPCGSGANFNALDWWGFVANSTDSTVFYLDDLSLTAKK